MEENKTTTFRTKVGNWVETGYVRYFIIGLIIINAITLGMETDSRLMLKYGDILHLLDQVILGVFVVEIVLKLYAFGWRFFLNGWYVFDFIIVGIALMPASGVFSVLRILRILRVLRLISGIPQLRFVIEGLIEAIPGIGSIFALLLLMYYIFAVIATKLFGLDFPEWFGSLSQSMYTLFQVMTLEGWSDLARAMMDKFPYAWLFFVIFILITTFTMVNLFVAIIVDTMLSLREHRQMETRSVIKTTIQSEIELLQENTRVLRAEIGELKALLRTSK